MRRLQNASVPQDILTTSKKILMAHFLFLFSSYQEYQVPDWLKIVTSFYGNTLNCQEDGDVNGMKRD